MSENAAVPFTMDTLKAKVRDSVRARFGEFIPEDDWNGLIDKEIKAFFTEDTPFVIKEVTGGSYGHKVGEQLTANISPFRALVWGVLTEDAKKIINETMQGEEFRVRMNALWTQDRTSWSAELSDRQKEMLKPHLPDMLVNLLGASFAHAMNQTSDAYGNQIRMGLDARGFRNGANSAM